MKMSFSGSSGQWQSGGDKLTVQKQMVRVIQETQRIISKGTPMKNIQGNSEIYFVGIPRKMQSRWKCFSQSPCRETFLKMLFLLRESYFILILQIWFMNSTNFMLWREKASTIRKGKLFKFCFSTDNHLIVEMGTFSHFHFCQLVAKSSFQNSSQSSMQLFWESLAWRANYSSRS